jgi:magnesium-protoporphyrin IX monomethyl ester (oxidative) cyclase
MLRSAAYRSIDHCVFVHRLQTDGGYLPSTRRSATMKTVEPLGLEYLVATLAQHGRQGTIVDESIVPESIRELPDTLEALAPDLIGFYTNDGITPAVVGDIRRLREAGFDQLIVVGGPASSVPEPFFAAGADIAVIGEGERTLMHLIEVLEGRRELSELLGVAWPTETGEVHRSAPQVPIEDLDALPYPDRSHASPWAYHDRWNPVARRPYATAVLSRGCPYRCTFCSSPFHWGKKTRVRTVESALDELQHLVETRGVRFVGFKDDIFGLNPDWMVAFCEGLVRRRLGLRWMCNLEPRSCQRDPAGMMALMREAGCAGFAIGLQAVDAAVLTRISRRPSDPDYVERLIRAAHDNGVLTVLEIIFGLPDSTPAADQDALRWALRVRPHLAGFYSLIQIPGSPILEEFAGAEVSPHQSAAAARSAARLASRRYLTHPRTVLQLGRFVARQNPGWFREVALDLPAVLDRAGVVLPAH